MIGAVAAPNGFEEFFPTAARSALPLAPASWEKADINARKMEDIAGPNKPAVKGRAKIVDVTQSTAFVTMSNPDT